MNFAFIKNLGSGRRASGMTLVEVMVSSGLAGIVLTMVAILYVFGLRSFAAMGNYADLDGRSRLALDHMSREIREAREVVSFQDTGSSKSLTVATTEAGKTIKYSWDAATGVLITEATGSPVRTNLIGCERWDVALFQRTPATGYKFTPTSDPALCKLVNMSWKCSRSVLGQTVNTETVLTAQIVLRNKR